MAGKNIKNLPPNSKSGYRQGYFIPSNPNKYSGDPSKIIYRSSWEKKFMTLCDIEPIVESWSSEPVAIKYYSPLDSKMHEYFVDFYCGMRTQSGELKRYFIEIKPKNQSILEMKSPKTFKSKQKYEEHLKTIILNKAKWAAADEYAKSIGFEFKVWTEENLGIL